MMRSTRRHDARLRLDALRLDARHAVRSLLRQPGLVATIVVTLALAVGANAAVFSVTDALLFRPPPGVVQPQSLYRLYSVHPEMPTAYASGDPLFDYPEYRAIRDALRGVAQVAVDAPMDSADVTFDGQAAVTGIAYSTPDLIPMLDVRLERGRTFDEHDDDVNAPANVAVASHRFAVRAFGTVDDALGRRVLVRKVEYEIIGVLAAGFDGVLPSETSLWLPLSTRPRFDSGDPTPWYERRDNFLPLVLRVPPGVDAHAVAARVSVVYAREAQSEAPSSAFARNAHIVFGSILPDRGPRPPEKEAVIATRFAAVAALLLLIACANVANLLLARGISRRREIGVRIALGISRARLAFQIFLESLVLAIAAGFGAIVVASWTGGVLRTQLLPRVRWTYAPVDPRVLAFTFVVTLAAAVIAGAVPAAIASRFGIDDALKSGARGSGAGRSRIRASLLALQASLCVVLLIGATLFWQSLRNVQRIDMGYDTGRLTVGSIYSVDQSRRPAMKTLMPEIAERMRALPGAEGAVATYGGPESGITEVPMYRLGTDSAHRIKHVALPFIGVGPEYFAVTGTRILQGRAFTAGDRRGAEPVIIVSAGLAKRIWPNEPALGQCLKPSSPTHACYTVVGVAQDVHEFGRITPEPESQYYYSLDQLPDTNWVPNTILVRAGTASPVAIAQALGRELRRVAPDASVRSESITQSLEPELRPWKLGAQLFAMLSGLALVVAVIGVYGVIAFDVRQRTREIGVRIALGAQQVDVVRLLVRQGASIVTVGIVLGIGAAYYAGRFVAALLYGVTATDPVSIASAAALLLAVAVMASAIPAWRANHIDPAIVLRDE